ncbi:MAG: formylglycine-generating enzyme [Methyloprofundus sp.]|nr:MAG: formylglycine-generating enzyme [Methyloprofundus sp.]
MKRQGKQQLGRADLLRAWDNADAEVAECVARQLGLKSQRGLFPRFEAEIHLSSTEVSAVDVNITLTEEANVRPAKEFWYLQQREQLQPLKLNDQPQLIKPKKVIWRNQPKTQPQHVLLATPQEIIARLWPYLIKPVQGRRIAVAQLVKKISQGEHITQLARQSKKQLTSAIHIIDDRHSHLTPYWLDNEAVSYCLQANYTDTQHTRSILLEGEQQPKLLTDTGMEQWQLPAKQSTVVILSDLACLNANNAQQLQTWLILGRQLQRQQCKVVVLLPCAIERCDPRCKNLFQLVSWQASSDVQTGCTEPLQQVEYLLTALAPCIRMEPSLIRQMRLALAGNPECTQYQALPIEIEALFWQHTAIQDRHSVAATWVAAKRKYYLHEFAQLPAQEQKTALAVIKAWRGAPLPEQIWFEELSSLGANVLQLAGIQQDIEDSQAYFQQLSIQAQQQAGLAMSKERMAWFKRLEGRIPEHCIAQSTELQRISHFVHQDTAHAQAKNIDPRNLPPSAEPEQQAVLIQQGERLYLLPYVTNEGRIMHDIKGFNSPLALIRLRSKQVQVRVNNENYAVLLLGAADFIPLPSQGDVTFISDVEVLYFARLSLVSHALLQITEHIARDQYGLYTDLSIKNITQRFRYIEPGTFMMGSPADEPKREPWGKETQHQVTLTKGFWMADTTVTQAFYQVVMGENPSRFKLSANHPVERVSWKDAQIFIEKLNKLVPTLQVQLPTEAQWEYACRAGSQTVFSFGVNITTEQVNYGGNYPYAGAEKGLFRKATVEVKSLPANAWGLYAMHGNVWEWCADVYQDDLGSDEVINPLTEEGSISRVIRGGSWYDSGWLVRSAMRGHGSPAERYNGTGFRLVLGH